MSPVMDYNLLIVYIKITCNDYSSDEWCKKLYVHIGDTEFSVQLIAKLRIILILWKLNVFYAIALGNTFIGWILKPDS